MTRWLLPGSFIFLRTALLRAALLRVECERGNAWRTSDTRAAASSAQQLQPDPQIDVAALAPDRILAGTLPPGPGQASTTCGKTWKR